MSTIHNPKKILLSLLLAAASGSAQAGLLGASVNVSAYYPDSTSLYQAGPDTIVSGAVEYPTGTFSTYNPFWEIDITDTQLILSWTYDQIGTYSSATFNGWTLKILSDLDISSAAPDAASQFSPVGISIENGNELFLNFADVSVPAFGKSIIDIATIPEPSCLTVLGLAFTGLALARVKRL